MKCFISLIALAYGIYFFYGWTDVKKDWQSLAKHLKVASNSENRIERKGIAKHFFYTDEKGREQLNIQARNSELIVHTSGSDILLQEEIEGVVGSYWDHNKAYTLFMPIALFDYPKKTFIGLQGKLEEFHAQENKLLGKGTFGEVECVWKEEPVIELKDWFAEIPGKVKMESGTVEMCDDKVLFNDGVVVSYQDHIVHADSAELDLNDKTLLFFFPKGELDWGSFSSNQLKLEEGRLTLEGKIVLKTGDGIYTSNGPLVVRYDAETLEPLAVHVEGKSALVWDDYTVQLDGLLHYEDEKVLLKAPRGGIAMKYPMGQIHASKGELQLRKEEGKFILSRIDLAGNVLASYGQPAFQYLIAEGVKVLPEENLATLSSKANGRVLLYDQINKLEMSADGVKVHWGKKIGEERIEGLGDVRFSFDQKERGIIDALFRSR